MISKVHQEAGNSIISWASLGSAAYPYSIYAATSLKRRTSVMHITMPSPMLNLSPGFCSTEPIAPCIKAKRMKKQGEKPILQSYSMKPSMSDDMLTDWPNLVYSLRHCALVRHL